MKRRLLVSLLLLCAGSACVFFLLAWVNNVYVLCQWFGSRSWQAEHRVLWSWLRPLSLDYSTASTAIPFTGFLGVLIGILRIRRPHSDLANRHFPFFPEYKSTVLAAGLMGNFASFMIFGASDTTVFSSDGIQAALFTGLQSSLVAFAWVYFGVSWIGPLMRHFYNATSDTSASGGGPPDNLLRHFGVSLDSASKALERMQQLLIRVLDDTRIAGNLAAASAAPDLRDIVHDMKLLLGQFAAESEERQRETAKRHEESRQLISQTTRQLAERDTALLDERRQHSRSKKQLSHEKRCRKRAEARLSRIGRMTMSNGKPVEDD